jgi:hypothetical protein
VLPALPLALKDLKMATKTAVKKEVKWERPTPQIKPTTLELAETKRNLWCVQPENDHTIDDMLSRDYWAHISQQILPGDFIEAVPGDRSYVAKFIVLGRDKGWALVKLLSYVEIYDRDDGTELPDGYIINFIPAQKWRVVSRTGDVLSKNHEEKADANKWLKEHLKNFKK